MSKRPLTRKEAWICVGILLALFTVTPLVASQFGTPTATVVGEGLFLAFCYWPFGRNG